MLTSDRIRVVLDTSVVINGLMTKKNNNKDAPSYKILRQFESNHFKLMMNARIKDEYDRKLNEYAKKGDVNASDVSYFMNLVVPPKAQYGSIFSTPLIDVVEDPSDNIFFLSDNCLNANYLVTSNSRHLNIAIKEDLRRLGSGLQIVNQTEFLSGKGKIKQ